MSLFDIAGQYPSQPIRRPVGQGPIAALFAALRRNRVDARVEVEEDANTLKHRRREAGYLQDIGMEMGL